MEEIQKDPFTDYEDILCRDGKKRRVYPAKLKYKDVIRKMTPKFNDLVILENIGFSDDDDMYVNDAWDSMMEVLRLAFDEKYSVEEIEDFLDFSSVPKVFEIFYGISSLKKETPKDNGVTEWDKLYASIVQNTSLTHEDVMNLTIPQLEYLLDGCEKNNKDNDNNSADTLEGADAIQFLINSGELK